MHANFHLAQVNIGRLVAPLDTPQLKDFVDQLDAINALAERSPGFVWRLQTAEGNATSLRPYDDDLIIVNYSIWDGVDSLRAYVYNSDHVLVLRRRREWFEKFDGAFMALWWVRAGDRPDVFEAKRRLDHLRTQGESLYAFSFKSVFAPDERGLRLPVVGGTP
jgi:hypothetical protein